MAVDLAAHAVTIAAVAGPSAVITQHLKTLLTRYGYVVEDEIALLLALVVCQVVTFGGWVLQVYDFESWRIGVLIGGAAAMAATSGYRIATMHGPAARAAVARQRGEARHEQI